MSERNISFKDNIDYIADIECFADFTALLGAIENGHLRSAGRILCVVRKGWQKMLAANLKEMPAAGGLVIDRGGRFLFIRRFGRWDLPKGGIEENESAPQAALREVREECGLDQLKITKELPATFHLYRSPHVQYAGWVLKKTSWFEMVHDGNGAVSPQSEEGIEMVRWFEKDELAEVYASTYANLKKMLRSCLR